MLLSNPPLSNGLPSILLSILSEKIAEFKGRPGIDDLECRMIGRQRRRVNTSAAVVDVCVPIRMSNGPSFMKLNPLSASSNCDVWKLRCMVKGCSAVNVLGERTFPGPSEFRQCQH